MNFEPCEQFDWMLKCRDYKDVTSTCKRRKIAAIIPNRGNGPLSYIGSNNPTGSLHCCSRDKGICPAIHAEVDVVIKAKTQVILSTELYLWAETPCHQCLSFIRRHSFIDTVYCLTTESYGSEYPLVLDRKEEIAFRDEYAKSINLTIVKLDREEILEYELLKRKYVQQVQSESN